MTDSPEYLLLKWGTLKGWNVANEQSATLLRKYGDLGMSLGAAQRRDTPEQKQILCDLIDSIDGEIMNDWSGDVMTKDAAKKYVRDYRSLS